MPSFVVYLSCHIKFQNNPIPVNILIRQKRERYSVIEKKSCNSLATLFSLYLIHLSNGGSVCEESFISRARFRQWVKWPTAYKYKQPPTTDNHQQQATTNNRQPPTTDNHQQQTTPTFDNQEPTTTMDSNIRYTTTNNKHGQQTLTAVTKIIHKYSMGS
jgi:hypothetical protein